MNIFCNFANKNRTMDYTTHYQSPLGGITLASDGNALVGLWFDGQTFFAEGLDPQHEERPDLPVFGETCRWLDAYFRGEVPHFTPSLSMRTSPFRRSVWQTMLAIPYGQTTTYGEIARRLGCRSAQAVGGAVAHNSISLIIPCHRVVGAGGSLTGYAGGIARKAYLLQMENALGNTSKLRRK